MPETSRLPPIRPIRAWSIDPGSTQPVRAALRKSTGAALDETQPVKVPGGRAARQRVLQSLDDTAPLKVSRPAPTPRHPRRQAVYFLILLLLLAAFAVLTALVGLQLAGM